MILEEVRKKVIETAQRASSDRLVPLTFGNFSIRDKETGYVCITPSGMPYHTLVPEDIVVIDIDGNIIDGKRRPSVEVPLHTAIYRKRPDVFGIVHTHSTFCTAWACVDGGLPCMTAEMADMVGKIKLAKFAIQGSKELAEYTSEALGEDKAVLMANHGVIFADKDIDAAYKDAMITEESAKVAFLATCIGKPNLLSDMMIKALREDADKNYGQKCEESVNE